ncbi:MAG: hypothetical protein ACKVOT_14035 [Polaromonas sp.]
MNYFSPSTKGFYNLLINGLEMPTDAVAISDKQHQALLIGQGKGQPIIIDSAGLPALAQASPGPDHDWFAGQWTLNMERQIARIKERLSAAVQAHMEAKAKQLGYDSLLSAISYADEASAPQFQKEGQALRAWRSSVWACCVDLISQVERGRPVPTDEELIALLPQVPVL